MNKILIVDASVSDSRVMSNLLMKAGYDPVCVESFESGKTEAAKLPPGAVIVTAMRLNDGTATDFIDWLKLQGKLIGQWNCLCRMYAPVIHLSAEQDKRIMAIKEVHRQQTDHFNKIKRK